MSRTSIDNLSSEIMQALNDYAQTTEETMRKTVEEVAKEAKNMTKNASPVDSGDYQKGWTTKKTEEASGKLVVTVYNRKKGSLTHLLEKGHANRGGGRTAGKEHIAPADEYAERELMRQLERRL